MDTLVLIFRRFFQGNKYISYRHFLYELYSALHCRDDDKFIVSKFFTT